MATTKRPKDDAHFEDTEDVLQEVGVERDEETGELVVDKETVRRLGVIDAESVLTNRQRRAAAAKRRRGEKIPFDTGDVLDKYDGLLRAGFPASAFYVKVRRLNGPDLDDFIRSCPGSGADLFEALKKIHGQNPSYQYMLDIKKSGSHQHAGSGRVTVPDTRPLHMREPQQTPYAPQPPFVQAPQAPPAAPQNDMIQQMEQMLELFKRMQGQPAAAPQPVPAPSPQMPSNPSQQMTQMFELFKKMQQPTQAAPQPAPQVQPAPQADPIQQMATMFDLFLKMQNSVRPPRVAPQHDPDGPPARSFGRPGYGPQHQPPQQQQPPAPRTPAESLRQALAEIKSFKNMMREIDNTLPEAAQQEAYEEPQEPDAIPFYTQEIGKVKVIRKKDDDEVQPWATAAVNFPDALKWATEQYEKFKRDADARRQQEARQRRVLPPGHIEVIPGQPVQVPNGFTAVVLSEEEAEAVQQQPVVVTPAPAPTQQLPPVPANIPPPVQAAPTAPAPPAWSTPIVPEGE